jgi:hypothetical protein
VLVLPLTLALVVALFAAQRHGTPWRLPEGLASFCQK